MNIPMKYLWDYLGWTPYLPAWTVSNFLLVCFLLFVLVMAYKIGRVK